jgi:predicted dehydrogenase
MHVFGTTGRIEVEIPFNAPSDRPTRLFVDDGRSLHGATIETIELPTADQYLLQGERFSEAVRGVGSVPSTLENAMANMAVLDALFRSAESGRWERP